jgi:hypothetical protein
MPVQEPSKRVQSGQEAKGNKSMVMRKKESEIYFKLVMSQIYAQIASIYDIQQNVIFINGVLYKKMECNL